MISGFLMPSLGLYRMPGVKIRTRCCQKMSQINIDETPNFDIIGSTQRTRNLEWARQEAKQRS